MQTQITIKHFTELTTQELFAAMRLRQEVFFLEQKIECEDLDDIDQQCTYLWAQNPAGEMIGFLRMIPPGLAYVESSIGRVAVAKSLRCQGIARMMMIRAIEHITMTWGPTIRISSQEYIIPFYESLGFGVVSEQYLEAGIPHRKMVYK